MLSVVLVLSAALAASPAEVPAATSPATIAIVPVSVIAQFVGQSGLAIIDLNPAELFARGHLPGARNVVTLEELPAALPADRSADVVFYCSGPECGRAEAAAREAARLGYSRLYVMDEGIERWMGEGWPTVASAPTSLPGPARPAPAAPARR